MSEKGVSGLVMRCAMCRIQLGVSLSSCRACDKGLVTGVNNVNWELYRQVRKYIKSEDGPPKGKDRFLQSIHERMADNRGFYSIDSPVDTRGMFLLLDEKGFARNPTGIDAQPLLFEKYDDLDVWVNILRDEGVQTEGWSVLRMFHRL